MTDKKQHDDHHKTEKIETTAEESKKEDAPKAVLYKKGEFVNYNGEKGLITNILDNDLETGQQLSLMFYFPPTHKGDVKTYDILVPANKVAPWTVR